MTQIGRMAGSIINSQRYAELAVFLAVAVTIAAVLIAPTHRGMATLRWPGWLITYSETVYLPEGSHPSQY